MTFTKIKGNSQFFSVTLNIAIAAWIVVVLVATLSPFRFQLPACRRADPVWRPPEGMVFDGVGMFSYDHPNPEIAESIEAANAFYLYLEAWPENPWQRGPRRLVSYSIDSYYQAFLIGQEGRTLVLRLADEERTPKVWTGREYTFADGLTARAWNSILVVCTPEVAVVCRDGYVLRRVNSPAFTPASWSRECRLIAGNEATGDRAWRGCIRRVELGSGQPPTRLLREAGLTQEVLNLDGREQNRSGGSFFDLAATDNRLPTGWRPHRQNAYGQRQPIPWSLIPFSGAGSWAWWWGDGIANLLMLVPLGVLLALRGLSWRTVLVLSCLFSVLIETTQLMLPVRVTQSSDVILNTLGAALGAIAIQAWRRRKTVTDSRTVEQ